MTDHNRDTQIQKLREVIATQTVAYPTISQAEAIYDAVFEQAQAPTGEEKVIYILRHSFHETPNGAAMSHIARTIIGALTPEPQDEPTDAQVLAGLNAENPRAATDDLSDWGDWSINRMRAALRAAYEVRGEGR